MAERIHKSILNAEVNLLFYFLSLFLVFFSRKVFLDCLGDEFIGLTGTLGNILGYLNLAELGIGSCISFFLYKPLQSGDRATIQELLSVIGYLYRWIGTIILLFSIIISFFFPLIFSNEEMGFSLETKYDGVIEEVENLSRLFPTAIIKCEDKFEDPSFPVTVSWYLNGVDCYRKSEAGKKAVPLSFAI